MNDRIKDLLGEVADGVEPGDRLDAIRAATATDQRTGRGWWAAGGVGLLAASVVTAVALTTGGTPQGSEPEPAQPAPTSPSETTTDPSTPTASEAPTSTVAVYYVGETPDGPRLYREFRRLEGDPLTAAVSAAVGRTGPAGPPLAPLDPDYRVPWTPLTDAGATLSAEGDVIEISFGGDPQDDLRTRGPLSEAEAGVAVEGLIRTAQAAVGERLPVRFLIFGEIANEVLGVPTNEPLAAGSTLDTLAHVSISDPSEGFKVDNDEPFTVTGVGNSFEGNIVTRIQRPDGSEALDPLPTIAGWGEDRLFPFEVTFDLTDLAPGVYVVVSQTDDPSGEGRFHVDTRRITVVD
jgi:hypothetical protein